MRCQSDIPLRFFFLFIFLILVSSFSHAGSKLEVLSPSLKPYHIRENTSEPATEWDTALRRTGWVTFKTDIFLPKSDTSDRLASMISFHSIPLSLSFFPEQTYTIIINGESRPRNNTLSLSGKMEGHSLASFSATLTPENYLITLQDLDTAMLYRVTGNTETGEGRVREMDLLAMPPMEHAPPLIPMEE
ncbi:hypothetical protein LZ24_01972 [Desulfobotulus alkaliphilus]|uniref:Uncharacterized protein n=1 Tax=Desulfobotulus alkaliphilus TaxID=622671 RepID=A0A562RRM5_9BACT|nr:hypothetical protein [Desulfobotulus alkaliphilus]TWI71174.1 hypothetical protein LZ24_01972 [Desulfobotulus alkaliphilus]